MSLKIDVIIPVKKEEILKTSLGKIQRAKLKDEYLKGSFNETLDKINELKVIENNNSTNLLPQNEKQRAILEAWTDAFNKEDISINDDFFEIGGDSIAIVQVVASLSANYDIEINDMFVYRTILELSENIKFSKDNLKIKIQRMKDAMKKAIDPKEIHYKESNKYKEYRKQTLIDNNKELSAPKEYKNILLTGATGYLGVYILNELIRETNSTIYLLVRGDSQEEAKERVRRQYKQIFEEDLIKYDNRLRIYNGDLSEKYFKLSEDKYNMISDEVDSIINCAANVKHFGAYDDFYKANVCTVERLIEFALHSKRKDINHISTGVVGRTIPNEDNKIVFSEYDIENLNPHDENNYVRSKIEAENLLCEAKSKGLNSNIIRVNNITFDSERGSFQVNMEDNGFYSLIRSFIKLGHIPNIELKTIDFSFVDYLSKAIVLLFNKSGFTNEVFHVFNPNLVDMEIIGKFLRKCGIDMSIKNFDDFLEYLYDHRIDETIKPYVESILIAHSLVFESYTDVSFTILGHKTNLVLQKLGFEWPMLNSQHIEKMLAHCKEVGFL